MAEELSLEDFVRRHPLPQVAKVTQGYDDVQTLENEFSTNDVITIHSVQCPSVQIIVHSSDTERLHSFQTAVSSRNVTRFRLRKPRCRQSSLFSSVQELCDRWPLTVQAQRDHVPLLRPMQAARPPPEFVEGDVLHLIRMNESRTELQCRKNSSPDIIRLPIDYIGPFREVVDESQLYTLGELANMAPVSRELILKRRDQRQFCSQNNGQMPWIDNVAEDFNGSVTMLRPEYRVEVSLLGEQTMVPLDCHIRVQARESDYVCVKDRRFYLSQLADQPGCRLPRIVRIIDWDEETTIMQNHGLRPGQRLVLFQHDTVAKLAVSWEDILATRSRRRYVFVPLDHAGQFRNVLEPRSRLQLSKLPRSPRHYPLDIEYREKVEYTNLEDNLLPVDTALRAEGIVDEESVLVGRISDAMCEATVDVFHLPLRSKLTVCIGDVPRRPIHSVRSCRDEFAEELSESAYNQLVGLQPGEVDYVQPQPVAEPANISRASRQKSTFLSPSLPTPRDSPIAVARSPKTACWSPQIGRPRARPRHSLSVAVNSEQRARLPPPPSASSRAQRQPSSTGSSTEDGSSYTALQALLRGCRRRRSPQPVMPRRYRADDDRARNSNCGKTSRSIPTKFSTLVDLGPTTDEFEVETDPPPGFNPGSGLRIAYHCEIGQEQFITKNFAVCFHNDFSSVNNCF